jgi:hypothetical protein
MTTVAFNHSANATIAGTTRTLLIGPVASGVTTVVFAGLFTNTDTSTSINHWITLERYDGTNYQEILYQIPLPAGSASMCPKLVLLAGESLYVTADVASLINCAVEVLNLS